MKLISLKKSRYHQIKNLPNQKEFTKSHTGFNQGKYTIKANTKDTDNLWDPWDYYEVEISRNLGSYNSQLYWFLKRFPALERLLNLIKLI